MVKRWLTPQYDRPGSYLEFFLKIQHVHGQNMSNPRNYDRPGSHIEFIFKDSTCAWSKDDIPQYDRPGSHQEFLMAMSNL